jgi:hypothetical protein
LTGVKKISTFAPRKTKAGNCFQGIRKAENKSKKYFAELKNLLTFALPTGKNAGSEG